MAINGLVVMTPTSIASTGSGNSSSINADGSVDFSSCATLSLNGVFTSSYDNYMVVCRITGTLDVIGRVRLSGTDATTNYTDQYLSASGASVNGGRFTRSFFGITESSSTQRSGFSLYLFGPSIAQPTAVRSVAVSDSSSARLIEFAATHSTSTAYDGMTLLPEKTGTLSGLLTVFAFNN